MSLLAFIAFQHKEQGQWDKELTGNLLSPAVAGQSKVHCLSRETQNIFYISTLFLFL